MNASIITLVRTALHAKAGLCSSRIGVRCNVSDAMGTAGIWAIKLYAFSANKDTRCRSAILAI